VTRAQTRGRRPQIAVAGGRACTRRTAALARALGRELADAGAIVICGGLGGVMAAVARGAAERGGTIVGLLPGYDRARGNPWLDITIPTGLGHARNILVAATGEALIALPGEQGTLSEIALARVLGRPVVVLGAWKEIRGVTHARTAHEAAARAVKLATAGPGRGGRRRFRGAGR
jgi:uncharacterized protein (TIGR00725 family)